MDYMKLGGQLRIKAAESAGWSGPWRFGSTHLHGTPPSGKATVREGDHVPDIIDNIIKDLIGKIVALQYGIESIRGLMEKSDGVAGLPLIDGIVPWSELEYDGAHYEWLLNAMNAEGMIKDDERLAAIKEIKTKRDD